MQQLLVDAFPDRKDFPTAIRKLIRPTKLPDESWTEYYFAKMELLRLCEITGKNAVAVLIHGIQYAPIQSGAKVGRYSTPEALYKDYLATLTTTRGSRERSGQDFSKKREKRQEKPNKYDRKFTIKRGKLS